MQKILDTLKRFASVSPPSREPNPYGDVLARAVAWSIDLMLLYYLLRDVFDRLAMRIYEHNDLATIEAVKRQSFGAMARDAIAAFESWQPALLLQSQYFYMYFTELMAQFFVVGIVVVGTQCVWGTTPGKFLIGLKIVRRKSLEPIARWRYVLRFLAYLPSVMPFMLGVIWCHFNKERRSWHDMIAGTVVIQTRDTDWYIGQLKKGLRKLRGKKD